MALIIQKSRVFQTSIDTGNGDLELEAPPTGARSLVSAVGDGNSALLTLVDSAGNVEINECVVHSGTPDYISRSATPDFSTNGGSRVNFPGGTIQIFIGAVLERIPHFKGIVTPSIGDIMQYTAAGWDVASGVVPTHSFRAYRSADVTNFSGDNDPYTCPLDQVNYNVGSAYNTSTYQFTALSDGTLEGIVRLRLNDAAAGNWTLARALLLGSTFGSIFPEPRSPAPSTSLTFAAPYSVRVVEGETVAMQDRSLTGAAGKTGTLLSGANETYWTGRFFPDP